MAELYGASVLKQFASPHEAKLFTFSAGESHKNRSSWTELTDLLLESGFGRDCAIVALGGGVVGDLAGFVASTYLRGVPYVQIPTTLLAMLDSSVGGKTGVDTPHGKNLVGTFYQPRFVVVDVESLSTLPEVELVAGIAEAIKHGAVADGAYFDALLNDRRAILRRDHSVIANVIRRSIEIKAEIVGDDERERGRRAILNFGHTVGHAVEVASDFMLLHGQAVAIGMITEAEIGIRAGLSQSDVTDRLVEAARSFGLPTKPSSALQPEQLLRAMISDKKKRVDTVRFALLKRIGCVVQTEGGEWTHNVSEDVVRDALAARI